MWAVKVHSLKRFILLAGLLLAVFPLSVGAAPRKVVKVGFFEAGEYYNNTIVRNEYRDALEHLVPSSAEIIYVANGFKTAAWKKDQCKQMAEEYVRDTSIDIVVAIGPWVVEALLKAGFARPIVGLWQLDPEAEGLLGPDHRPIANNLTVQVRPDQIKQDLSDMVALYHPKVVGVLAFNKDFRDTAYYEKCWQAGKKLGIKIVWAQGYNADGVFAYFKGYSGLPRPMDALYVGPLWGLSLPALDQFSANARNDMIPVHTSEGRFIVEKGLSSSSSVRAEQSAALFAAMKTVKIIQGAVPSDLPLEYPSQRGYILNKAALDMSSDRVAAEIWAQAEVIDEFAMLPEAQSLTLAEALANAQTQNPGLQGLISRIDAAGQRLDNLKRGYLPEVSFEGAATAASKSATDNTFGEVSRGRYRAGIEVQQPLFAPQVSKSIRVARSNRTVDSASLAQAELDVQRLLRATYRDCLDAQRAIAELSRLNARIVEFKEIARLNNFIDPGAADDTPRWEVRRLENLRDLMDARRALQEQISLLHLLMGRPVLDTVTILDSGGYSSGDMINQFVPIRMIMSSERFSLAAEKFMQVEALAANPAMRLRSAEVSLAESRIAHGKASRYPSLGLRGWFGLVDSLAEQVGFDEKHDVWSITAQMRWPLFAHTPPLGVSAEREAAVAQKDSARLLVEAAVGNEWKNLWRYGLEMPLAAQSAAAAAEYADSVKFDYVRKRRTVLEAIDALDSDYRARMAQLSIKGAFFQAADDLAAEAGWLSFDNAEPGGSIVIKRLQEYLRRIATAEQKP